MEQGKVCGAKTKDGGICQARPMDNGRCWVHSGRNVDDKRALPDSTKNLPGRPPTHGMYSKYKDLTITEKLNEFMNDPDFTSLQEELSLARVLLQKFMKKRELDDGNFSTDDLEVIDRLMTQIRRLSDTFVKIEVQKKFALSPEEIMRVIKIVVDIIRKHVTDDAIYQNIKDDVSKIKY